MKKHSGALAVTALLVLILDSRTAFQGAALGLELSIKTVVPALFPFLVLSGFLLCAFSGENNRLLRHLGMLFRLPANAEYLMIPALMGGYPVGAQSVYGAYATGGLSQDCAEKMLFFCSNAGPSFLFGILPLYFEKKQTVWCIWLVQLMSIYTLSQLIRLPQKSAGCSVQMHSRDVLKSAIEAMAKICGWVVLGKMIVMFFEKWFLWLLPPNWKTIIVGCLELTNGCSLLYLITDERARFIICCCMLAFGGLCVMGQTKAMIGQLRIRYYCVGKVLQTGIALLYSGMIAFGMFYMIPVVIGIIAVLSQRQQKKSSIPQAAVV